MARWPHRLARTVWPVHSDALLICAVFRNDAANVLPLSAHNRQPFSRYSSSTSSSTFREKPPGRSTSFSGHCPLASSGLRLPVSGYSTFLPGPSDCLQSKTVTVTTPTTWKCRKCHTANAKPHTTNNNGSASFSPNQLFCRNCKALCDSDILSLDLRNPEDVMALFNLGAIKFDISLTKLKDEYLNLQLRLHPDRFASSDQREREDAADISSTVSLCYSTLRDPLSRAALLLEPFRKTNREASTEEDEHTEEQMALFAEILEIEEKIEGLETLQEAKALHQTLAEAYSIALEKLHGAFLDNNLPEANKVLQRCQMFRSVERKVSYWLIAQPDTSSR